MSTFNRIDGRFAFVCKKVLPLVYDDSLSYYEFLCKMYKNLNDVITELNSQSDAIEELQETVETLETSVEGKFDADNVVQSTGQNTDKVMSQKAVTDNLVTVVQGTGTSTTSVMSQNAVTNAIDDAKTTVVQSTGSSTTAVMSQNAVTNAIESAGVTVVQSTGTSTTSVMSQNAVTNALGSVLPSYSASDAGKVLKVNSSGTGLEWASLPSANGVSF